MIRLHQPLFITMSEPDFRDACRRLAEMSRDVEPDVIVGLATGGVYVAEAMHSSFPTSPAILAIRLHRPSTALKESMRTEVILRRLPCRIAYLFRWIEVATRECTLKHKPADEFAVGEISGPGDRKLLRSARRVLVVDDTVDSGRTLQAASKTIRSHNDRCEIYTAVLASTWRRPPVSPDFVIFVRTLVRFHWSLDVR